MTLKKILEDENGNSITISVDYDRKLHAVEMVNYVMAESGSAGPITISVDITDIFIDQMNGDEIIDKIDWEEVYANYEPPEETPCDYDWNHSPSY